MRRMQYDVERRRDDPRLRPRRVPRIVGVSMRGGGVSKPDIRYRVRNERTGAFYRSGTYGGGFDETGTLYIRKEDAERAIKSLKYVVERLGWAAHRGVEPGDKLVVARVRVVAVEDD